MRSLVAIPVPVKQIAHNAAAIIPGVTPILSGLATISIPKKPIKAAKSRLFVNFSDRKIGANKATHIGTENSKAVITGDITQIDLPNAFSVLAASEQNNLFFAPDTYMETEIETLGGFLIEKVNVENNKAKLPNPKLGYISASCWSVEHDNMLKEEIYQHFNTY